MNHIDNIGTDLLPKHLFPNAMPQCEPPSCFIGSYAPPAPPGMIGPFGVNTFFLQPDRRLELSGGPLPLTHKMIKDYCT